MSSNNSPSQNTYRQRKKKERIEATQAEIYTIEDSIESCKSISDVISYLRNKRKSLKLKLALLVAQKEITHAN